MEQHNGNGKEPTERTRLLSLAHRGANDRRLSQLQQQQETESLVHSSVTKEEHNLSASTVGERLPYQNYATIDWLHDLVCLVDLYREYQL
jgi:chloride channel 3/4/5